MYKDAIHEGFTYRKYSRSIVLSGVIAVLVVLVTGLDVTAASGRVVLYGLTYGIERAALEFYKTFLREEDQSKYFIPMQLHVLGEVVESRRARWLTGFAYLAAVLLVVGGIRFFESRSPEAPAVLAVLVVGSAGGWISALGGAWKDAPLEGFQLLKFFRSPVIALFYALAIAPLTDSYVYVFIAAIGYTVGTIETYKTFFFPDKPRGKFAGKQIRYPGMLARRKRFVPLFVALWAAVVGTYLIALAQPHTGLL
jgi:uncharacterized membrane protein (UPF0136 family)